MRKPPASARGTFGLTISLGEQEGEKMAAGRSGFPTLVYSCDVDPARGKVNYSSIQFQLRGGNSQQVPVECDHGAIDVNKTGKLHLPEQRSRSELREVDSLFAV